MYCCCRLSSTVCQPGSGTARWCTQFNRYRPAQDREADHEYINVNTYERAQDSNADQRFTRGFSRHSIITSTAQRYQRGTPSLSAHAIPKRHAARACGMPCRKSGNHLKSSPTEACLRTLTRMDKSHVFPTPAPPSQTIMRAFNAASRAFLCDCDSVAPVTAHHK